MKHLLFLLAALSGAASGTLNVVQSGFSAGPAGTPSEWTVWSARPEIAPRAYVDERRNRNEPGSLAISGNGNAASYGGWEHTVRGVENGQVVSARRALSSSGTCSTNRCRLSRGWIGSALTASGWGSRTMPT